MLCNFRNAASFAAPGNRRNLDRRQLKFHGGETNPLMFIALLSVAVALLVVLKVLKMLFLMGSESPKPWNKAPIKATYVTSRLTPTDKDHATISLSYDLDNNTDFDYRFASGSNVLILGRLRSDGSLNQQEAMRLGYPVFLPAGQRARISIEITEPFAWPTPDDAWYLDKLRYFVKERLEAVGEFVVFDEERHQQFTLPWAWEELQGATQASNLSRRSGTGLKTATTQTSGDDTFADRKEDEFGDTLEIEFLHDVGAMRFNRINAKV